MRWAVGRCAGAFDTTPELKWTSIFFFFLPQIHHNPPVSTAKLHYIPYLHHYSFHYLFFSRLPDFGFPWMSAINQLGTYRLNLIGQHSTFIFMLNSTHPQMFVGTSTSELSHVANTIATAHFHNYRIQWINDFSCGFDWSIEVDSIRLRQRYIVVCKRQATGWCNSLFGLNYDQITIHIFIMYVRYVRIIQFRCSVSFAHFSSNKAVHRSTPRDLKYYFHVNDDDRMMLESHNNKIEWTNTKKKRWTNKADAIRKWSDYWPSIHMLHIPDCMTNSIEWAKKKKRKREKKWKEKTMIGLAECREKFRYRTFHLYSNLWKCPWYSISGGYSHIQTFSICYRRRGCCYRRRRWERESNERRCKGRKKSLANWVSK